MLPIYAQAQYFSGEIVYDINIIPKSDTVDVKAIIDAQQGDVANYLITSKRYKSTYLKKGVYSYSYTYDDTTQRMIDDYLDRPYLTFRDARSTTIKFAGSEIHKDSTTTILGYDCYMVRSESSLGMTTTYYSDAIKVDYTDFEGHEVGNWYNKLKEVDGAITLKSITEYDNYYEVREAIKVDRRTIEDVEFELDDKPMAASYTALDESYDLKQPTQEQIQCYQEQVSAASKLDGTRYVVYVRFLLTADGTISFVEALEEDEGGLYKVAKEVVQNCGLEFIAGKIGGHSVDAEVYFPVEFLR